MYLENNRSTRAAVYRGLHLFRNHCLTAVPSLTKVCIVIVVAIPVSMFDINHTFAGCVTAGLGQWSSAQQGLKDAMSLGGGCEDYLKGTVQQGQDAQKLMVTLG